MKRFVMFTLLLITVRQHTMKFITTFNFNCTLQTRGIKEKLMIKHEQFLELMTHISIALFQFLSSLKRLTSMYTAGKNPASIDMAFSRDDRAFFLLDLFSGSKSKMDA